MDPQIFSHPGFLGGVTGGLLGLLGGGIGFYFSWKAAKSRQEKRGLIFLSVAVLLLVAVQLLVQFTVENRVVQMACPLVYTLLLIGLCLFYNRFQQRVRTQATTMPR